MKPDEFRACELAHVLPVPGASPTSDFERARIEFEGDCASRQQADMTAYNTCCQRMSQLRAQRDAEQTKASAAQAALSAAAAAAHPRFPVFNGTQPACVSEEALDELTKAIVQKDQALITDIERRRDCVMPTAGTRVSIISGIFTVKVRAITSQGSMIMWVPREGLGTE